MIQYTKVETHLFKDRAQFETYLDALVKAGDMPEGVRLGLKLKDAAVEVHQTTWTSNSTHGVVEVQNLGEVRK